MTITISFDDEKLKAIIEQVLNDRESKKVDNPGAPELIVRTRGISTDALHLSMRSFNGLKSHEIESLEDLLRCTRKFLGKYIRNLGNKSLNEIEERLEEMGYKLGSLPPFWVIHYGTSAVMSDDSAEKSFFSYREAREFCNRENEKITRIVH